MTGLVKHTILAKGWLKGWAVYLLVFPFYFFPAGSAQPSDLFVVVLIGFYLVAKGFRFYGTNKDTFLKFLRFCGYLTLVNFVVSMSLIGQTNKGLPWFIISAFYIYNLVVMGFALSLYRQYGKSFLFTTLYACILSGLLQLVLSNVLSTQGEGVRGALFFTNPNQLGYYSLCALSIVLVLESMLKIPRLLVFLSFFVFTYMAILSVSMAAMGAMIILMGAYLIANKVISLNNVLILVVIGGVGFFVYNNSQIGTNFQRSLEIRNMNQSTRDSEITEWEYRGYDRISNHPYYLVLGAGEGGYNRFDTFIEDHEMHSSVGTIIFCYGIPGTILFATFVLSLFKRLPWYYVIYALPLFSFGLTHMGLRFTIFWVALMMFPIIRIEIQKTKYKSYKRRIETAKNNHRSSLSEVPAQGAV